MKSCWPKLVNQRSALDARSTWQRQCSIYLKVCPCPCPCPCPRVTLLTFSIELSLSLPDLNNRFFHDARRQMEMNNWRLRMQMGDTDSFMLCFTPISKDKSVNFWQALASLRHWLDTSTWDLHHPFFTNAEEGMLEELIRLREENRKKIGKLKVKQSNSYLTSHLSILRSNTRF